jgi:hypothetical protein
MSEELAIIHDLRKHYEIIYDWHKKKGIQEYRRRFETEPSPEDVRFAKYARLLQQMPHPQEADLEAIAHVAHEVRCGCMEWSYCVEPESGLPLSKVAAYILETIEQRHKCHEQEAVSKKLRQLQNTGRGAHTPATVLIVVPDEALREGDMYARYAALAYHDAIAPADRVNLGGMVALADTNLEHESGHQENPNDDSLRTLTFRNARALHMVEDEYENSLVTLIRSGDILVESVKIGVGD